MSGSTGPKERRALVAAWDGDTKLIQDLLKDKSVNINCTDKDGRTFLYVASYRGHAAVVKLLLERGAKPLLSKKLHNWAPIHAAALNNHFECVRLLVQHGAETSDAIRNIDGAQYRTPVFVATEFGLLKMLELLIELDADVNLCGGDGWTPLHIAAVRNRPKCTRALVVNGASLNTTIAKDDSTPLYLAASLGHNAVAKILLKHNALTQLAVKKKLWTPLHVAASRHHVEVAKLLVRYGANAGARGLNGKTPLFIACSQGLADLVKVFLESGDVDLNATVKDGRAPIHAAVQHGHKDVVSWLVHFDANCNATAKDGVTPVYIAATRGYHLILSLLKNAGAYLAPKTTEYAMTPLHGAASCDNVQCIERLLGWGYPTLVNVLDAGYRTPLACAAARGHKNSVAALLSAKADPNLANTDGMTPAYVAALGGHYDALVLLADANANLVQSTIYLARAPIHAAALGDHAECAKLLAEKLPKEVDVKTKKGQTALHLACQTCESKCVSVLLACGANVDARDEELRTPLILCAEAGHCKNASMLIEANANVNLCDKDHKSPASVAVQNGTAALLEILITDGHADVTSIPKAGTNKGLTLLHLAAKYSHVEMVKLLLPSTPVNVQEIGSSTPLHQACNVGSFEIVELLLESGADVNASGWGGASPLMGAVPTPSIVKLLIKSEADVNKKMIDGEDTALHIACRLNHFEAADLLLKAEASLEAMNQSDETPLFVSVVNCSLECVNLLLKAGADPNADSLDGSILFESVRANDIEILEILLNAGADVDALEYENGSSVLHTAVNEEDLDAVMLLIKHISDIDRVDDEGCTALFLATYLGCTAIVRFLVDEGADVNIAAGDTIDGEQDGYTPIFMATSMHSVEIMKILLHAGANPNTPTKDGALALHNAVEADFVEGVKLLLTVGDASTELVEGGEPRTPLMVATRNHNLEVVKLLVLNGANLDSSDAAGYSPLQTAAWRGFEDIVEFLLTRGANVNHVDYGGRTSLYVAVASKLELSSIVTLLLHYDADTTIVMNNDKRYTPLHRAAINDKLALVPILLEHGCDINAKSKDGSTAFGLACMHGHIEIAGHLAMMGANVDTKGPGKELKPPLKYLTGEDLAYVEQRRQAPDRRQTIKGLGITARRLKKESQQRRISVTTKRNQFQQLLLKKQGAKAKGNQHQKEITHYFKKAKKK